MIFLNSVQDVRNQFVALYQEGEFVTDKSGTKTLEIFGASFVADEPVIFGKLNEDYAQRELEWYKSMSLYVNDIPGGAPKIWEQVASKNGRINSNYGYLIYSTGNHSQYKNVLNELKTNPFSRRAVMIYTRPSIWNEYNENGMSDFICTNAVGYAIRNGKLNAHVSMRSNDVIFGYKNDKFWQDYVHSALAEDLGVEVGQMVWTVTSLHIYERLFNLIK